jgi:hypothetical protein
MTEWTPVGSKPTEVILQPPQLLSGKHQKHVARQAAVVK